MKIYIYRESKTKICIFELKSKLGLEIMWNLPHYRDDNVKNRFRTKSLECEQIQRLWVARFPFSPFFFFFPFAMGAFVWTIYSKYLVPNI